MIVKLPQNVNILSSTVVLLLRIECSLIVHVSVYFANVFSLFHFPHLSPFLGEATPRLGQCSRSGTSYDNASHHKDGHDGAQWEAGQCEDI